MRVSQRVGMLEERGSGNIPREPAAAVSLVLYEQKHL